MNDTINVNGEMISKHEALQLIRMFCNDARKIAGEFHNLNRSEKFRINWPDEYRFADANWRTFMEATRAIYAERLGDPKTSAADARKMHLAIVLHSMAEKGGENDTRLQLAPGTQQFDGDKHENKKILENFGRVPNLRAALMNSAATRH